MPTESFVFCIIALILGIYGLGHFLTQGEGTYIYVKYTCEAMKIFVLLTHHGALGKYAPASSVLLSAFGFAIWGGGGMSKKKKKTS